MINKTCINNKSAFEFQELSRLLKVLAEENRLRILCLLKNEELCVCEIFENLELSQNLVSSHLKVLKGLELITLRQDKQKNYYSINKKVFKKYNLSLTKFFKSYE